MDNKPSLFSLWRLKHLVCILDVKQSKRIGPKQWVGSKGKVPGFIGIFESFGAAETYARANRGVFIAIEHFPDKTWRIREFDFMKFRRSRARLGVI